MAFRVRKLSGTFEKRAPAPSWLDSSVGRALHRYRRGHGFNSITSLNFISGSIFTTAYLCIAAI